MYVSGAGLDPQWRVDVERRTYHGQLATGSRAAAEGTRAVPACHRGRNTRPVSELGLSNLKASLLIPSRGSDPGSQNRVSGTQNGSAYKSTVYSRGRPQAGNCTGVTLCTLGRTASQQGSPRLAETALAGGTFPGQEPAPGSPTWHPG